MQREQKFLGVDAFKRAALFLRSQSRPLEAARFERIFQAAKTDRLLLELKKFQNDDGGFGHALEPDVRAPESSVICTSVAFQIIRCHGIAKEDGGVRQAVRYFVDTLDRRELHWRLLPEAAEAHPHAPWWSQTGREAAFNAFSLNPTAEILGYVLDYGDSDFEERVVSQLTDRVLEELRSLKKIEMHDLLCCLRLLETKNLSSAVRAKVSKEVERLVSDAVARDPDQWQGYCLRPLQVVSSPDSPFLDGLEKAVSLNLDYEIEQQEVDGSWSPTWEWGDDYRDAWTEAKREWTGILTLDKLMVLRRFNRIEAGA